MPGAMPADTVVFDVNETLLDLAALDPLFERYLGAATRRRDWFAEMLVTAMTLNHLGRYENFSEIGRACLATTAARAGMVLEDAAAAEILGAMQHLPPHSDVIPALQALAGAGLRLAALTNSPPATARSQLGNAALLPRFAALLTVEEAGRLKPARKVYVHAAGKLGRKPHELVMVAAHTWDLSGAAAAGWRTALVARDGRIAHPLYPPPDIVESDLSAVVRRLA